jgi:DNA replication protein DnaC
MHEKQEENSRMGNGNDIEYVCVKLTKFGASLKRVQVQEGIFSFDFRAGETQKVEKLCAWEKILKPQQRQGKPLFEVVEDGERVQEKSGCQVCGGTGWRLVQVEGKSPRVMRCQCWIEDRSHSLLSQANIPERYRHCTLSNFETDFENAHPSLHVGRLAAGRFVEEFPFEREGLLLWGTVGTGKTHLAVGIIQELIRSKGTPCFFCDYRELFREILHSYQPSVRSTEQDVLRPILDTEVLVLDELGAVNIGQTEWVWDTVSYILNSRYNDKKTTIITTNYPDRPSRQTTNEQKRKKLGITRQQQSDEERNEPLQDEITLGDRITDRMLSRLHEMCRAVELKGVDYRRGPGSVRNRQYGYRRS